jgi:hypothetical protein
MDEQTNTDPQPAPDQTRDDIATTEPETRPIDTPQDPVAEQSDESFPASDPPSFTGSTTTDQS